MKLNFNLSQNNSVNFLETDKIRLHKKIADMVKALDLEYTLPEIHRNIENYGVFVDSVLLQNRLSWIYPLQEIDFSHWPQRNRGNFEKIQIILENENFLLIYKPPNLVVEAGAGHQKDNLQFWLQKKYPKCEISPVHRLDKDTQGLLLIAKNRTSLDFFQNQFRARTVKKSYFCKVNGIVEKNFIVRVWQARDKQNPQKQKAFLNEAGAKKYYPQARKSVSIIHPFAVCPENKESILKVQIKTGRTHQIRLHCQLLGFPLTADPVYTSNFSENLSLQPEKMKNEASSEKKNEAFEKKKSKIFTQIDRKEKIFFQPITSFYAYKSPQELSTDNFLKLQRQIFGETEFCLLSNYLEINLGENSRLAACYN